MLLCRATSALVNIPKVRDVEECRMTNSQSKSPSQSPSQSHSSHRAEIRKAEPHELEEVLSLLVEAALPADGVETHFDGFFVATQAGQLVGAIGLERYGTVGLLRSLVVSPDQRSTGLGRELVLRLIDSAREHDVGCLYLLTTTAEAYFPRFGFEIIERADADPRLSVSREFQDACPDTAVCMRLRLDS
jgi:amino-acid N-acetyltransferase